MEDFKNRLLEFARVHYDMGQSKFEDLCEINRGTISAIKVQGPTAQIIMKISSKCPELNLNWLFRGTGDMILDTVQHDSAKCLDMDAKYVAHLEEEVCALRKEKEELWQLVQKLMK